MLDIKRLKQDAQDAGKVFELTYYTDQGPRALDVFMVRHRDPVNGDDFTIHDFNSGGWLGAGDTKEDAQTDASIRLHQHFDFGIPLPPVPRV